MARFISPGISSTTATASRFRRAAHGGAAVVVLVAALVEVVLVAAGSRAAGRGGAAGRGRSSTASRLGSAAGLLAARGLTAGRGAAAATVVPVESLSFRGTDDGEQAGHKQGRENVTESHERAPSGQLKGFLLANPAALFSQPDRFGDRLVAPRSSYGCYRRWQERSLIRSPVFSTSPAHRSANERKTRGIPAVPLLAVESRALKTA